MKNKINLFILSIFILLAPSCTNWLDVTPQDTIVEDELFKEATGYRNALNGIYKQMSSTEMYGKEMSWGFTDVIGQCYSSGDGSIGTKHPYYVIMKNYDYEPLESKGYIQSIWSKTYNTIANCNNLIKKVEREDGSRFIGGQKEKDMIIGECYALRALLHLDILRLFAPAPIKNDGGKFVPYVDVYPCTMMSNITTAEVLSKIIADLIKAEGLVSPYDNMDDDHQKWLTSEFRFHAVNSYGSSAMPSDIFYAFRGYRLNVWAINAILARAYNYAGNHTDAMSAAQKVIDAQYLENPIFQFADRTSVISNKKTSSDIIFTLSYPKLYQDYLPFNLVNGDSGNARLDFELEYELNDDYHELFDDPENDYRFIELCKTNDQWMYYSTKNLIPSISTVDSEVVKDMLPMVRLSEMYYIIAEGHAAKSDLPAAIEALDKVRDGRGCIVGNLSISDYDSFKLELLKEVKREFIGEGQIFFFFKKLNNKFTLSKGTMADEAFVLPLPENQTIN